MSETIIVALISAGLASLVNCIFEFLNKISDTKKEKEIYNRNQKTEYLRKKEEVYTEAIQRLLEIREGFDFDGEYLINHPDKVVEINESNKRFKKISPLIRLYSTDEIFSIYYNLGRYSEYSYSNDKRLIENSKKDYEIKINILSKLMQNDLGYRELNQDSCNIKCPKCKKEHDMYERCPKCGMDCNQFIKNVMEQIQQRE